LCEFAENLKLSNLDNEGLYESIESMKFSEQTNTLVFTGDADAIQEIKNLLANFDVADSDHLTAQQISGLEDLGFLVYKLQYHKGNEIQEALKQIAQDLKSADNEAAVKFKLVKSIDSVQWIKITNSLLCSGDKDTLTKLKELISNLDVPLKQVFIEILVIQTTLTNALSFGLDWGSKMQYKDQAVVGMSNFTPVVQGSTNAFANALNKINTSTKPTGTDLTLGDGFNLGVIGDILFHKGKSFLSLASLLRALQTDQETSIVLTPKIIAQDGKSATIFSGQNIPYTGSVIQNTSQNTLATTNLEYRDVGTSLTITPILGNSDTVSLTIDLETSSTASTTANQLQLGSLTGITTTKTNMSTAVQLANKNFLVLSGMVTDSKTRAKTGIPCLGGIPLIGSAFSRDDKNVARNNIVIFVRPHIINSFKDMQSVTNNQEDYFREQAGTPTLERDYDESVELIKSYEND
jgi:type III secretion protein C